ncbi:MAG: septum site-determining protein MinC [Nitrosomonas sp.]|nr:septum site-determining protein MinC [Nitrosomonas sp.]
MSLDVNKNYDMQPVLEFKSSTFFVLVLIIHSNDLMMIEQKLREKTSQAQDFFRNSPIILDVHELNQQSHGIDIIKLINLIRDIGLFPVGIRGGNDQQNLQAASLFIPVDMSQSSASSQAEIQKTATSSPSAAPHEVIKEIVVSTATTLINQPVRSGQRIYASGDLIILTQVSAGAEIMAEGNIHVYNTLRGRALAGVQGNRDARIFCSDLQAELISIAGDYKTSEDLKDITPRKPVQIYLQDQALIIKELI